MKSWMVIFLLFSICAKGFSQSSEIIPLQFEKSDLSAAVFGFLPDDRYLSERSYIRYDLLTHIGCIEFHADSLGNVGDPPYWPWTDVINNAHENGVKVILCTANFVASEMHYLMHSDSAKHLLFANLKDKVLTYQLDGVNIDFERFDPTDSGDLLNAFLAEMTAYLHQEIPGCEVSFAGPHYNWGGNWKFDGLADACDYLFLMGYAFAGSFSTTTGSNAPLLGGTQNITTMLTQQYGDVLSSNPGKLILGVPYYGNKWVTASPDPHAAVVSFVDTQPFSQSVTEARNFGLLWEDTEMSPWYRMQVNDTTWYQVWFDNDSSLGLKYELAKSYGLKGVGMWALGYDGNRPELWGAIEKHFVVTGIPNSSAPVPAFELFQNYPNPFNPTTRIAYSLPQVSNVVIKVYDVLGTEIKTLVNKRETEGTHEVRFDGRNLPSGVYFYRMETRGRILSRKMILLK